MSSTRHDLFGLMPAIHRIRDAEIAAESGLDVGPLESLLSVVARELAVVEEGLERAYDDLFIETCAPWVVPYIGDLIGYQSLHGDVPEVASPRAEVAHTIGLRRRKGTALVLEQLARDVTRWDARVVEYFQTLATTQYMNHRRLYNHQAPDLRDSKLLNELGSPFNRVAHTVDVRRIGSGRGRHNIPNIGVHLWRITAWRHRLSPAVPAGGRRFRVSPLGHDIALFNRPNRLAEENIEHIAEPLNVPRPLPRGALHRELAHHYRSGPPAAVAEAGLLLEVDDIQIPVDRIVVCDLSDDGAGWAHEPPAGFFGIDPELGRLSMPPDQPVPAVVRTTYHRGFSAALGGGEYEREATFALNASTDVVRVPDDQPTVSLALAELAGSGTVEITDNGRYEETPMVAVSAGATVEVRAANGRQPTLVLGAPMRVTGGPESRFALNGLWITGERVEIPDDGDNALSELQLSHLTLVPGQALAPDGTPLAPAEPSLVVGIADLALTVVRSVVGAVLTHEQSSASFEDCTIDATAPDRVAYAGPAGAPVPGPAGALRLSGCTVIGKVRVRTLDWVSNSILLAQLTPGDGWAAPVWSSQKQVGCVRFSYLPFDAISPSRYRCQPDSAASARSRSPGFTSLKFGTPAYCQLSSRAPAEICRGADNESEMGVFSYLLGPQREANLRIRLGEYLRVGLEAGVFNAT